MVAGQLEIDSGDADLAVGSGGSVGRTWAALLVSPSPRYVWPHPSTLESATRLGDCLFAGVLCLASGAVRQPRHLASLHGWRKADGLRLSQRRAEVIVFPTHRPVVCRWLHQLLLLRLGRDWLADQGAGHRPCRGLQHRPTHPVRLHRRRGVWRGSNVGRVQKWRRKCRRKCQECRRCQTH